MQTKSEYDQEERKKTNDAKIGVKRLIIDPAKIAGQCNLRQIGTN